METGWYESVSLSDYFGVIARRKWIVLLVTVLMTVSAVAYSKNQTPKYQATAELLSPVPALERVEDEHHLVGAERAARRHARDRQPRDHRQGAAAPEASDDVIVNAPQFQPTPPTGSPPSELLNVTTVGRERDERRHRLHRDRVRSAVAEHLATAWAVTYGNYVSYQNIQQTVTKFVNIDQQMHPSLYTTGATDPPHAAAAPRKDAHYAAQIDAMKAGSSRAAPQRSAGRRPPRTRTRPSRRRPETPSSASSWASCSASILAFLQDLLDKRIRTADEVGRRLRVPLLASIPTPPRSLREHPLVLLAPRGGAQGPSAEAYRIAKLNLGTVMRANRAKAVMFVSAADSEGTSRTAAQHGRRARPHRARTSSWSTPTCAGRRIDGFFGLDDRTGLSDILSGHGDLGRRAHDRRRRRRAAPTMRAPTAAQRSGGLLEVLPAGPPPADAADLLESRAMAELLGELRGRADIVLIDAPPMLPVTDAMMLGAKVDGVIVVARARLASRPHMVALARALDACAAPTLGFLFTGVSVSEENEYGGYVGGRRSRPVADTDAVPRDANCCESRARLLVGRPPHPASPAEAVVGEARAHLGDVRPARRPVAARG